ncbi:MAG: transcription antitermination protein NusB [Muribaculaceae bacterium]|nr:transcription antitermination protein NusB [Muribaculaceae bacterium]
MINRVLIRMKTVQLLYSYLLVEKPFSLESQPSAPTKEKRFAYSLYLDLIYLMDRLAQQVKGKNKSFPLADSRFVLRTEADDRMKSLRIKYAGEPFPFSPAEDNLRDAIKESLLFREYEKNRESNIPSDSFWENVFKSIILPDPKVNEIIRSLPGYSLSGVDRMKGLMDATFKNFYSSKDNIDDALKTLAMSMQKARDLYMRLLALPVELTALRLKQLEQNRRKLLATTEDLNPNMRLVNNPVAELIEKNPEFSQYVEKNHLSWQTEDPELLDILLKAVLDSEIYAKYSREKSDDINEACEFWKDIIVDVILTNREFLEYLENKSVFWNDDLEIMASFVLKTLKRLESEETAESAVMPMYKDGDNGKDAHFGAELFNYVVKNKEVYRKYINEVLISEKWEADRLAFMDVVITMTALAEIINYPEIPLNVTINEYIEIAKSYSSAKSGQFVHGLLASLVAKLKEDGVVRK